MLAMGHPPYHMEASKPYNCQQRCWHIMQIIDDKKSGVEATLSNVLAELVKMLKMPTTFQDPNMWLGIHTTHSMHTLS